MVNHLKKVFKNKLHGEYSIDFTNFGTGEYIDIKYNTKQKIYTKK